MSEKQRNPFQILGLSTETSTEHIQQRGQELLEKTSSDEQRQLYQWAVDELTTDATTRLLHAINEMPRTAYKRTQQGLWKEKQPVTLSHNDMDLSALLDYLLAAELEIPAGDTTAIRANAPYAIPDVPFPLEMEDVIFG